MLLILLKTSYPNGFVNILLEGAQISVLSNYLLI
jgi:hypothetical protein